MDLSFYFHVSGVETNILLPSLFMFFVSAITSTAGVSGAFVLLPFQVSYLGYTSPGASGTNFIYNIVSIPAGAYKFFKDKRLSFGLLLPMIAGTMPGIFLGYYIRVSLLPDSSRFKVFAGAVLLYLAFRLLKKSAGNNSSNSLYGRIVSENISFKVCRIKTSYEEDITFSFFSIFIPSLVTGVVGGAYGIGGGAIMSPYCVAVLGIPVYFVAGPALVSTWIASVISALFYMSGLFAGNGVSTSPDLLLGFLFGLGGVAGIYCGAHIQRFLPQKVIRTTLGLIILGVAVKYIYPFVIGLF